MIIKNKKNSLFIKVFASATIVSVGLQILGLARQSMTVTYFGLGRDLDFFWTAYAMANITVFTMNIVIESSYIAMLTKSAEETCDFNFRKLIWPYAMASALMGVLMASIFFVLIPILGLVFSAGFTAEESRRLSELSYWFIPWVGVLAPYYGLAAILKFTRSYNYAFGCELLAMFISIVNLMLFHESIDMLPLSYFAGYLFAICIILFRINRIAERSRSLNDFPWRDFLHRAVSHYCAIQTTAINTMAERFWISFVPAGGIAAIGIVQQLQMGLGSLVSFRDAYLVPLSIENGRAERLKRLFVALVIISSLVATYVSSVSFEIVELLFQYGRVGNSDVTLMATLLSISMLSLIPASVAAPIWRTLHLVRSHHFFIISKIIGAIITIVFGGVLVGLLGIGAYGIAIVAALNSWVSLVVAYFAAKDLGLMLLQRDWLVIATILTASFCFSRLAVEFSQLFGCESLWVLILSGSAFLALAALLFWTLRNYLKQIVGM